MVGIEYGLSTTTAVGVGDAGRGRLAGFGDREPSAQHVPEIGIPDRVAAVAGAGDRPQPSPEALQRSQS